MNRWSNIIPLAFCIVSTTTSVNAYGTEFHGPVVQSTTSEVALLSQLPSATASGESIDTNSSISSINTDHHSTSLFALTSGLAVPTGSSLLNFTTSPSDEVNTGSATETYSATPAKEVSQISEVSAFSNPAFTCDENNRCPNGGCCSWWGFCGTSADYCEGNCWLNCANGQDVNLPAGKSRSLNGECNDSLLCPPGNCCSNWGFCGATEEHCESACASQCQTPANGFAQLSNTDESTESSTEIASALSANSSLNTDISTVPNVNMTDLPQSTEASVDSNTPVSQIDSNTTASVDSNTIASQIHSNTTASQISSNTKVEPSTETISSTSA